MNELGEYWWRKEMGLVEGDQQARCWRWRQMGEEDRQRLRLEEQDRCASESTQQSLLKDGTYEGRVGFRVETQDDGADERVEIRVWPAIDENPAVVWGVLAVRDVLKEAPKKCGRGCHRRAWWTDKWRSVSRVRKSKVGRRAAIEETSEAHPR